MHAFLFPKIFNITISHVWEFGYKMLMFMIVSGLFLCITVKCEAISKDNCDKLHVLKFINSKYL